jgi:hypothetical protein
MPIEFGGSSTWRMPTRTRAVSFWLRSRALMIIRAWRDHVAAPVQQWPALPDDSAWPVISEWRSALWDAHAPASEWPLSAGKVQNLRIAASALNGITVPAGEVFSFWKHIGRVRRARGFAVGREVREGCVIPTLGGGLCQLSNALATCAAQAGFTLVERHGHTAVLGTGRPELVDATVFWNYVDLRVRSDLSWRIEAVLTDTELVVRLRGTRAQRKNTVITVTPRSANGAPVRNCLSCDERECFRHQPPELQATQGTTALLLDAWSQEFERYLRERASNADAFVPRTQRLWRLPIPGRAAWRFEAPHHVAWWSFLLRSIHSRFAGDGGGRQAAVIHGQRRLALAYATRLRPQHTHVIVDQALLPHLASAGALQGRRVTVLAHSLPMQDIERRLDDASRLWPDEPSLRDFRAQPALARAEMAALSSAQQLVCMHREVAAVFQREGMKHVELIDWAIPETTLRRRADAGSRPVIVFPCSVLARKGSRELAEALQGLDVELLILGNTFDVPNTWQGIRVSRASHHGDWIDRATLVAMPAHVEHSPRAALRALAAGIPIIATPACGLDGLPNVHTIASGDAQALRAAITHVMGRLA